MKNCYCPEGKDPKDHKFIKTKVVTMLIQVAETCNEVNKNGDERKCGEEDNEGRNGKQQCDNVSFPAESVMKKQRENTEEMVPPHLYTIHAKHVTIIPEDIQIALQYT